MVTESLSLKVRLAEPPYESVAATLWTVVRPVVDSGKQVTAAVAGSVQ
jgi:hypothetical protein